MLKVFLICMFKYKKKFGENWENLQNSWNSLFCNSNFHKYKKFLVPSIPSNPSPLLPLKGLSITTPYHQIYTGHWVHRKGIILSPPLLACPLSYSNLFSFFIIFIWQAISLHEIWNLIYEIFLAKFIQTVNCTFIFG